MGWISCDLSSFTWWCFGGKWNCRANPAPPHLLTGYSGLLLCLGSCGILCPHYHPNPGGIFLPCVQHPDVAPGMSEQVSHEETTAVSSLTGWFRLERTLNMIQFHTFHSPGWLCQGTGGCWEGRSRQPQPARLWKLRKAALAVGRAMAVSCAFLHWQPRDLLQNCLSADNDE